MHAPACIPGYVDSFHGTPARGQSGADTQGAALAPPWPAYMQLSSKVVSKIGPLVRIDFIVVVFLVDRVA
jgi:hypothetical protein